MSGKLASAIWVGGWALATVLLSTMPAHAHNFVGAQSCASCHPFEYRVWSQGPHARAHLSLSPEQRLNSRCSSCHSTASLVEESASPTDLLILHEVGAPKSETKAPTASLDSNLLGVQCETCHGPGKLYQPEFVMRDRELARWVGLVDPSPASCQSCHTDGAPSLTPFDYKTMWGRIDHGRQARLQDQKELAQKAAASQLPVSDLNTSRATSRERASPSGTRPAIQPSSHRAR